MPVEVILPRVDMGMETGIITQWYASEGAKVGEGQKLFEMETDKAAMDIEAPASGYLHHIRVGAKRSVPVGDAVAYIYAEGEVVTAPPPQRPVNHASLQVVNLEKNYCLIPEARGTGEGTRATPSARRLAREAGLPIAGLAGTGPLGRISADDVRAAVNAAPSTSGTALPPGVTAIPTDGMRRTIAERLTLSKQSIPHYYLKITCNVDRLQEARAQLNKADTGMRISLNDLIIKAYALALQHVPAANVVWTETAILQHSASDIGIAIAIEGGLFTPVLRSVENKSVTEIATEVKELATRARARKLAPADYHGGTTAISNLGMYGIDEFSAIINPPQSSILAIGAATEEFVPVDRKPVLMTRMRCTLSCDHRAIDGAVGAQLLQEFRALIENPDTLLN